MSGVGRLTEVGAVMREPRASLKTFKVADIPSPHEPHDGLFERCPRCLKSWDLFPVYR
jgi:hypothetical protein